MKLLKSSEEKYVLVIFIPESFETPHILSDGVVYLRNGEESNPIKMVINTLLINYIKKVYI